MSVHPADGDNTAGARAPEPPTAKKAWTQPDPIEPHANGDSSRVFAPAAPSDARAPEPPTAKKSWTQPDPIERHANGDSSRVFAPAAPSDQPPALGVEEDTAQPNQKLKRRVSLTALLPYPSPVTPPVQHCRSAPSVGTLSWNLPLMTPKSSTKTGSSSQDLPEACPGGLSRICSVSQPEPAVLGAQNHDAEKDVATVVSVTVKVDLVDVNLIIIGSCGEAVELLRRRRQQGGRTLLLWTNRPQQQHVKEKACNAHLRIAGLNMSSFVWNPPAASDPASPMVHRMRRQHGCSAYGMSRFGPDIFDLRDVECYRVQVDDFGHECGVEVSDEMSGNLVWAMSGAVVFCGPCYVGHGNSVCSSIAEVESLDVSVNFQEAMPLATTTTATVVMAFFHSFVFLIAYFIIMGHFELIADSEHWPWWRLSWVLGPGLSMGALTYPQYCGITLFGHQPPVWFCGLGSAVFITCMGLLFLPIGWTMDFSSPAVKMVTCSAFTASSGGGILYLGICVSVHLMSRRFSSDGPALDWYRHSAWTCAHLLTTIGTGCFLYGISLAYVWMEMSFPQTAALFLVITTNATEKVASKILNFSYTTFIYTPRSSIDGSKNIIGDQRRYLTIPVAMTHSYCEAVRLVSLLSITVRSPSWAWLPSVVLNVSFNLMDRTQLLISLAVRVLPRYDWMCPGLSLIALHDVRLHAGYAQYVAVLALLVAEIVSGGLSLTSVLNKQCVILIFCCMLLEILEDVLVHVLPRSDYWRRRLSPYYEQQPVLHPKQLLLMDHQGPNYEAVPLALHGQRSLTLGEVVALMWPSSLFTYFLMTLLLGAGYIHGVCDEPIPKETRFLDALFWESPLRCS